MDQELFGQYETDRITFSSHKVSHSRRDGEETSYLLSKLCIEVEIEK
jgi:hypothetical protein